MTTFRQRYGPAQGPPVLDAAPKRVRARFVHVLSGVRDLAIGSTRGGSPWDLLRELEAALALPPNHHVFDADAEREDLLLTCDWFSFFEAVEFFSELLTTRALKRESASFRDEVNRLLAEENVGYRLDDQGKLRVSTSATYAKATRAALSATDRPDLQHLRDQLLNALEQLTLRRLDPTNAVKDAVGALQGVVRIRLGKKGKVTTEDLTALKSEVHPAIAGSIDALVKIVGFRGDMAGHDAKSDRAVTPDQAVFVVHQCAAAIALLAAGLPEQRKP